MEVLGTIKDMIPPHLGWYAVGLGLVGILEGALEEAVPPIGVALRRGRRVYEEGLDSQTVTFEGHAVPWKSGWRRYLLIMMFGFGIAEGYLTENLGRVGGPIRTGRRLFNSAITALGWGTAEEGLGATGKNLV